MTSPNREKRSKIRHGSVVVALLGVLILIGVLILRPTLENFFWRIWSQVAQVRMTLGDVANPFASKAALEKENTILQAELASTTALLADRNMLYQETLDLENRLSRNGSTKTILGVVLMRPPALPYDVFVIDVGSSNGVITNDLVSAGGTLFIGIVSQVYDTTSRVTLFSTPGETYAALLHSQNGTLTPISIEGQGGGSLVSKVPIGVAASVGDSVVLPTLSGGIMATVSAVVAPQDQSFETLYLQMPVNPFALQYVEVWKQ